MRPATVVIGMAVLAVAAGCQLEEQYSEDENARLNAWLVNMYVDIGIENAILRQHTLYPYHFVANSGQLNELGKRDLLILAGHYRENPGELNINQGGAADPLYKQRIETCVELLVQAGVDASRVQVDDGLPGGEGMSSRRVVRILTDELGDEGTVRTGGATGSTVRREKKE